MHRDIKPANVMLTRTGQVKVMDFGIARAMGDSGMTMTQTAAVIGTAQYLSPEQAKGEQVDARSDLYSAGCLLYELLSVRPPFVGDSPVAVAYQHVREEPQPPSNFDPEITPEMDAIVLKALVKDPDYRYQSADEMRADIEACLDGQPVAATASMGAAGYGYPDQGHGYGHQGYDQPTAALRTTDPGGQTSMMPPMPPGDGGYGYGDQGQGGYDQGSNRRQKKSKASTVLLVAAGILVLVGAILIGRSLFGGEGADNRPAVPKLVGQTLEQATKSAVNVGLVVAKGPDAPCEDQPKGNVCKQDPAVSINVAEGTTVTVTISTGAPKESVPDVVNLKFEEAEKALKAKGFQVDRKPQESERTAGDRPGAEPQGRRRGGAEHRRHADRRQGDHQGRGPRPAGQEEGRGGQGPHGRQAQARQRDGVRLARSGTGHGRRPAVAAGPAARGGQDGEHHHRQGLAGIGRPELRPAGPSASTRTTCGAPT